MRTAEYFLVTQGVIGSCLNGLDGWGVGADEFDRSDHVTSKQHHTGYISQYLRIRYAKDIDKVTLNKFTIFEKML